MTYSHYGDMKNSNAVEDILKLYHFIDNKGVKAMLDNIMLFLGIYLITAFVVVKFKIVKKEEHIYKLSVSSAIVTIVLLIITCFWILLKLIQAQN